MQTIDTAALQRLLDEGAQLVEVLPEKEYREEHLPDAINIPLRTLRRDTVSGLDPAQAVVVYCYDFQ